MIKVHVVWLNEETHSIFRRKCLDETGFPGEFLSKDERCSPKVECRHNHDPSICKCHPVLFHFGQDEAVYRQYAISSKEWTVDGACKM